MRTLNSALAILVLLCGCGFLRTTNKELQSDQLKSESSSVKQEQTNFRKTEFNNIQDWKIDSIIATYNYTIWPDGVFSFSLDSGFKGVAKKIDVRGNIQSVSQSTSKDSQQIYLDSNSAKLDNFASKIEVAHNTKKQLSLPAITPFKIFLGVIFVFFCYAFFKKFKIS